MCIRDRRARERRRVGNAVVIVGIRGITLLRLIVRVGVADVETFGVTALSSGRMSLAFPDSSHLEVGVDLVEGVLPGRCSAVEEEDVASRGPAD